MSSPANNHARQAVIEAAIAVGIAMATDTYAVVGGATFFQVERSPFW